MKKDNNYNSKNIDDIPLTDLDYQGVIYEPSQNNSKISPKKTTIPAKKKQAQNFNYSYFLIGTICLGVVIFGIIFFLTYNYIAEYFDFPSFNKPNISESQNISDSNKPVENDILLNENTNKNIIGVLKYIDTEKNTIELIEPNSNKNYILKLTSSSELKDKYENPLSIVEFFKGDIVDFSFDSTNKLIYMKKYENAFLEENVSNFNLDLTNSILKYNGNAFKINKNVLVYKDIIEYPLEKVSSLDTLNIKGIGNDIYYIEIKKGNGIIKFENKPNLPDATLEIDRDIFKPLSEINTINIKEGLHKIVIRSGSISPFVKEIEVTSGNETIIDLTEIQNKRGYLSINTNISDYNLYINEKIELSREPLSLSYGTYNIKIEKEGYQPFNSQVLINKPQVSLQANLEKFEKLGKLDISSNPTEAQVFVNNAFIGYTPLNYKLPYGTHNIVLKKEGYLDFNLSSITIGENESVFNITMHKKQTETTETTTLEPQTETTTQKETIIETTSE